MRNIIRGIVGFGLVLMVVFGVSRFWGQEEEPKPLVLHSESSEPPIHAELQETGMKTKDAYGKLPLHFEPNVGQTDEQVDFVSRGKGYALFLTGGEAVLALSRPSEHEEEASLTDVVRLQLLDANPSPEVQGVAPLSGKSNYLIGNDASKWTTGVPHYGKVKYDAVYPGIDLVYYGTEQRLLEHDFIVSPGSDPDQIRFSVAGAELVVLDDNGNLIASTKGGDVVLQAPVTYQEIDGERVSVESRYKMADDVVGFELAAYDMDHTVVIDPVLSYSTYLGGGSQDRAHALKVDSSGNVYVTGLTISPDFPAPSGFDGTLGGNYDGFVSKINSSGSGLVYSTYLGGSGYDQADDIALDGSGNAYVVGRTGSTNFPTQSPYQVTFGGANEDVFVSVLNNTGSGLIYSTYLGGTGDERGSDIAVDASGNVYITGYAQPSFPTQSPIYTHAGGTWDAFVAKFNSTGSSLVYSTFLGGSGQDFGSAIAIDGSGNVFIMGTTVSSDIPTLSAYQPTYGGGAADAFVAKINSAGSALLFATYLGGSASDNGQDIALHGGNVFVSGHTLSTDFPIQNAYQSTFSGVEDVFVSKLSGSGNVLLYSTYLGGSGQEQGAGIAVDTFGNIHVAGFTKSTDFPLHSAVHTSLSGSDDAFVSVFTAGGSSLVYSTYLSGSGIERGNDIALDASGNAYIVGYTASNDYPTLSAYQTIHGGNDDAFITKLTAPTFFDVADVAGVNSSAGDLGLAWADYDGDGDQDVYIASRVANKLYSNNNDGTFTDVASGAVAHPSVTNSVSWADYDNDGDVDLYIGVAGAGNVLFENDGSGTLTPVPQMVDAGNASGQAWADFDKDGDLDLYLGNFGTSPNRLYQNNGNGTFTDIASSTGMNSAASTAGSAWADYDNDGDPDLYVNHPGSANRLFRNDGSSTFSEVGSSALVNDTGNGRGVLWGDIDNDGDIDIYAINDGNANKMYENNGNGTFTSTGGVEENTGSGTGGSFGDYDNDGDLDLHLVRYNVSNILYDNDGTGLFTDASVAAGIGDSGKGFDGHFVDYDNDGDLDIYVVNDGNGNVLYKNNTSSNNWLQVDLTGTASPNDAMGAQIDVHLGATTLRRWVDTGSGYNAQTPHLVHFGLGSSTSVDSILVRWPSGIEQDRSNVSINQIFALTEANEAFVSIPDTVASYTSTIQVPIRIDQDISGKNVVAAEISVAFDNSVVTMGSPDKTLIAGTMVAAGWSVEENVFSGVGGIDTLSIAMSTAADTLSGTGDLVLLVFDVADIRSPTTTPLELTSVLFNEGSPVATNTDGSITITGTDATISAAPDSIRPGDVVTITVDDADADLDVGVVDQVTVTAFSLDYSDNQTVTLTETGVNTGSFVGTVNTVFSLVADPSENGVIGTIAGDSIGVTYQDVLTSAGTSAPLNVSPVPVYGGTDGDLNVTYVVQAFDGRNGVRDTVRVEVADADLDTDVGVAEQVSATITNAISGEVENVTLTETGVNTGVFQVRVPTIAGVSGTNDDGELSLASWDTLDVAYNDALSSQGGLNVVQDITRVVNLFGDVRVNDQVQAFDAARLLAISVNLVSSNTQTTLVGDVDDTGAIGANDAAKVLQYVVRLIDRFPVQTDFVQDPKNHPFEKPVPLGNVIALGEMEDQGDGTFLLPVSLGEREGIISGMLTLGMDAGIEVVDVDLANAYGSFMVAHNMTDEGLKVAFAGSQSELVGSGDVVMLRVRGVEGSPVRLSLDHVVLNGQTLTPSVNIEAMEEVIVQAPELITELHQNIPNPFNPQTTIKYALAEAGQVEMVIYSVTGQRIRTLVSEFQNTGSYQIVWDGKDAIGRDVSSGVYLMRMQAIGFVQTRKILLLR